MTDAEQRTRMGNLISTRAGSWAMPASPRPLWSLVVAAISVLSLIGCSQVEPVAPAEPVTDPSQVYLRLVVNQPAVNLTADATVPAANTLQLVALPYNAAGTVIAGAPAPTFRLLDVDTTLLRVSPTGLIQGLRPGTGVRVLADLTIDGVRQTDTTVVNITDVAPVPVLDTFSIHVPAENALWYVPDIGLTSAFTNALGLVPFARIALRAVDPDGASLLGLPLAVNYRSLDSTLARVNRRSGFVTPVKSGQVRVVASTFAYGVEKADTMTFAIQEPFGVEVYVRSDGFSPRPDFTPTELVRTIVVGGIVGWGNNTAIPTDVTFDDPTNVESPPSIFCTAVVDFDFGPPSPSYCGTGNIAAFARDPDTSLEQSDGGLPVRWRRFPVTGTYTFRSTLTGATGRIVVVAPTLPTP